MNTSLPMRMLRLVPILSLFCLLVAGCSHSAASSGPASAADANAKDVTAKDATAKVVCAPDNGGITLPKGFCATLVIDGLGLRSSHSARHLAVAANGDIYMKTRSKKGGIVALRDTTGDFHADIIRYFGHMTEGTGIMWATGIAIHNGYLWASNRKAVYRWPMPKNGQLVPQGKPQIVVSGFPKQWAHSSKSFTFDDSGHLYVVVSAPSNACQKKERETRSPGMDPCPLLKRHGGIWRFEADKLGQTQSSGKRYVTGIRNIVGLDWNSVDDALFAVMQGRDQLHDLWPNLYTVKESAELPAEQMLRLTKGANVGWPYCYYDQIQGKKVLAPEYGGNGKKVGRCSQYVDPVVAFPGHWAPEDLLFYTGKQFPKRYRGGAFVAFHGSWNRAPLPQQGYKVVFVPFKDGKPSGGYKTFAAGFAGVNPTPNRAAAKYRAVGLAMGPHGALYISDSKKGRIWRVVYAGKAAPTVDTAKAVPASTVGTPPAAMAAASSPTGAALFRKMTCATCHSVDPKGGGPAIGPPLYGLYGSKVTLQGGKTVMADEAYLRESILHAPAQIVAGYMAVMPTYEGQLTREQVSRLVSYIKSLKSRSPSASKSP